MPRLAGAHILPTDTDPPTANPKMHWTTILTTLSLTAISATLFFWGEWSLNAAFTVVGIAATILITLLLAALYALTPKGERKAFTTEIHRNLRKELRALVDTLRFRR